MDNITSFFEKSITEKSAISFLINGRKKDNQFYNYLVKKIISQLEVSYHIYPIGPSLLVYNTKSIISPIYEDGNSYILEMINKLDKDNKDHLIYSKEYINKLPMRRKYIINSQIFKKKIGKYLTEEQNKQLKGHYKNFKKWIEINISNTQNDEIEERIEKDIYIKCFHNYMNSLKEFKEYLNFLKMDIISNYKVYKMVFTKDYKKSSLLEIVHDLREKMINDMLIKYDNGYRNYDLTPIAKDNRFFKKTAKPEQIVSSLIVLNNEYEEAKKIKNTEEYVEKAVIIFQKFIKIHPYKDGNGRTSRFLLDIMLLNKGIFPPILYNSNYERYNLDNPSHEYTLNDNEKPIVDFIKNRIAITKEEYSKLIK